MPVRPSTSSGPESSKSAGTRPNSDKRLSKDDLALTGRVGMGKGKRGLQPYIIGVKGPGLLTPEPSPHRMRMPSPSPVSSVPARLPTTPASFGSGEIPIGMALGSPTQAVSPYVESAYAGSPYVGWKPQSQTAVSSDSSPSLKQQKSEPPIQRTKTQKRRIFGSLFGGKKQAEPAKTLEAVEPKDEATPARSNTITSRKTPKHKPIIIMSTTEPETEAATQEPVPSISTAGLGLLNVEIPDVRLERYSVMFSGVLNPNGTRSTLLERRQATLEKLKTVNDVTADEEGPKGGTRQRRASSPQPTKSPGFTLFPPTPGRQSEVAAAATSSTTSLAPPRGLARSNTSPAHLPSPSRPRFEPETDRTWSEETARRGRKTVTIVSPRTMDERNRAAQVEKLREQQTVLEQQARSRPQPLSSNPPTTTTSTITTTTFHFGPEESALILDSPQSISSSSSSFSDEDDDTHAPSARSLRLPLKPALPEPQWQMITPPPSTSSSASTSTSSTTKRSIASSTGSASSVATTIPEQQQQQQQLPPLAAAAVPPSSSSSSSSSTTRKIPPLDDEEDAALKAAVEISIARQISISRQQRSMLLRPLGQKGVVMSSSSPSSSTSSSSLTLNGGGGGGTAGGNGHGRTRERSATAAAVAAAAAAGRQEEQVVSVGVVKGRVVETRLATAAPGLPGGGVGGAGGIRRSERVVLDVME